MVCSQMDLPQMELESWAPLFKHQTSSISRHKYELRLVPDQSCASTFCKSVVVFVRRISTVVGSLKHRELCFIFATDTHRFVSF